MTTIDYRNKLNEFKGQRNSITKLLKEEKILNEKLSKDAIDSELAHDIITLVGQQTQEQLTFRIENLVTAGLEYMFEDPVKFKVEFDTRRNQQQCDMFFEKDGALFDPIKDFEGTVLDPTAITLRLAVWSLPIASKRTSPVFLLDEALKHVSRGYRGIASSLLKELCSRLGIQVIAITHEEELIDGSDNVIKVIKEGKYSKVEKAPPK